jgi:hypothetical protein
MRGDHSRFSRGYGFCSFIAAVAAAAALAFVLTIGFAPQAQALPSFARQTGQPCGTCHTDFPALTPFGRRFKLLGYTTGGGLYRTTPFSNSAVSDAANAELRSYAKSLGGTSDNSGSANASGASAGEKGWVPPVSMMAIVGYTHTQADLPAPTDPYKPNDNTVLSPFSAFWGGAITDHIGAFAQVTYNAPPAGGFADPFGHTWTWDNTDVRFASTANIGALDLIYGITANNSPSVQDLWNTTPAWAFPYAASTLAGTPDTKPLIEGAFAAHVGGVGVYTMINDLLYLEATGYKTLDFKAQDKLGVDPFGAPGQLDGVMPYWRAAVEPHWDNQSLMVGTFGMIFNVNPWIDPTFALGTTGTFTQTDKYTDIGFDTQYQYQGSNYWLTLRASYIHEFQRLDASFNGFSSTPSSNPTDTVNSLNLQASFAYGGDNRVVFTGQYFDISGTADLLRYGADLSGNALTPNSNGWIGEIAYIPFGVSKAPGWPWFNARIGLQYTYYNKFNGTTIGAQDNNTVFLHAWFAM